MSLPTDGSVPLLFPESQRLEISEPTILAADIGGSQARLGLFTLQHGELILKTIKSYRTSEFSSFPALMDVFMSQYSSKADSVCLGVAGPVVNGQVTGTNFAWTISRKIVQSAFPGVPIQILNDMQASAYGLATLRREELKCLLEGAGLSGNAAIIAPGTGLGEVGMCLTQEGLVPFASEGGHCDYSPRTELEMSLWRELKEEFGHVSWERLISGPGIVRIYAYLRRREVASNPSHELFSDPQQVSQAALDGSCQLCQRTMEWFFKFLAVECSQLALKFNALGGIYIGGGIVPEVLELINIKQFKEHFYAVGRLRSLMEKVPVRIILRENTPLWGAAAYGAACIGHYQRSSDHYQNKV